MNQTAEKVCLQMAWAVLRMAAVAAHRRVAKRRGGNVVIL